MAARRTRPSRLRSRLRETLWPGIQTIVWPQPDEAGWCKVPRVLPIILRVLSEKTVSGDADLSRTFLGLLCDNYGEGVVEVTSEATFAETAGFRGPRGVRSWRQRVLRLAELGFLRVHVRGNKELGFVAILHPYAAMADLRQRGLVHDGWWALYQKRLAEVGAVPDEDVENTSPRR